MNFWFIDYNGKIVQDEEMWLSDKDIKLTQDFGNYFKTRREAREAKKRVIKALNK